MTNDNPSQFRPLSNTEYDRANQNWICGRECEGGRCPNGPTTEGECRADFECQPIQRADSWVCTRAKSSGGTCEKGPLPDGTCCKPIPRCVPVRSLRSRRLQVSVCVFSLATGLAAILLSFPSRSALVSPGPLTHQHATTANSCADCHSVDNQGLPTWINNALTQRELSEQSQKCLVCHREIGDFALNPHSTSLSQMEELTQHARETGSTGSSLPVAIARTVFGSPHGSIQCAACHKEHQGASSDLKLLSNQQCQVCHTNTFHSFSEGHPEFASYPFRRRARIYFDHNTHYGKHFARDATGNKAVACIQCHVQDATGSVMELRGYEATCAECHDQQITDDLHPGLEVAALPALDVESLAKAGLDPELWPETGRLHAAASGHIPPLMKLLLLSDSRIHQLLLERGDLDLADLRQASPEDLDSVLQFVRQLKDSLQNWEGRQPATNPSGSRDAIDHFADNMISAAQISALYQPYLDAELAAARKKALQRLKDQLPSGEAETTQDTDFTGRVAEQNRYEKSIRHGWYMRGSDLTLRYRATGHADEFLKQAIELAVLLQSTEPESEDNLIPRQIIDEFVRQVSSPFVSGRCMKCHTIDHGSGTATVNWYGKRPDNQTKPFTRFRHSSHTMTMSNSECSECHILDHTSQPDVTGIFRPEFIDRLGNLAFDASEFRCDFSNINKRNCSSCHTKKAAGNSCLDCHNYHIR